MSSALSIAATGLQTANRQVETAARSVVSSGVGAQNNATDSAKPAASAASQTANPFAAGLPPTRPVFDTPDLATGIVDLKQAQTSYKAQLEVLNIASKLEEEAINLIA